MSQEPRIFSRKEDRTTVKLLTSQLRLSFSQQQKTCSYICTDHEYILQFPVECREFNPWVCSRGPLSIFVQVFCCQAEVLSWMSKDELPPALSSETAQVCSACKALGCTCFWSGWLWTCSCMAWGTYRLDLSAMRRSRISTEMVRTGKSNSIRSKKLFCKEESKDLGTFTKQQLWVEKSIWEDPSM